MRLLLDEMYPAALADQLRNRGHDVSAVTERREFRSLPDADLFAVAQQERRALVTENIADFIPIVVGADERGVAFRPRPDRPGQVPARSATHDRAPGDGARSAAPGAPRRQGDEPAPLALSAWETAEQGASITALRLEAS